MFREKEKRYQIYHTLLSMALSWALSLAVNQYFELHIPVFLTLCFSFLPAIGFSFIQLNRKNALTYLIIAGILLLLILVFWVRHFNPAAWMEEYSAWIALYDGSKELYQAGFSNFTGLMTGVLSALLFFLLTKNQLGKMLLAAALVIGLVLLSIGEIPLHKLVIAIVIFYILSVLVESFGVLYARKAGKQEKRESILYLLPVCLLLAFLSVVMPSREEPIRWKTVRYVYENIREQIEIWKVDLDYYFTRQPEEFFISITGYSEDSSELGNENDRLVKNDNVAIRFSGSGRDRAVYLTGAVSDTYTGHSWEKSGKDYLPGEQEYQLDYLELIYALSRQEPMVLENNRFIERMSLKLQYSNIKTKTFFYPLKMNSYRMLSETAAPVSESANLAFGKIRKRGTRYENSFYEMNLQGEAFINMLKASDHFSYQTPPAIRQDSMEWLQANPLRRGSSVTLEDREDIYGRLGERAQLIRQAYTALPQGLPSRVGELAQELTADCDTNYDKLKAIEAYLSAYTYSLSSKQPEEGQDFIDYFLFEGKEGYCTSYATAMAVLGRCVGIPTRYVEGFIAKYEEKDKDGMYLIRNSQAHAWAEAYFEGVGWIPFEATSPFQGARYTRWAEPKKESAGTESGEGAYVEIPEVPTPPLIYNNEERMSSEQERAGRIHEVAAGMLIFMGGVLILLLMVLLYYTVLAGHYRKLYDREDDSGKMYLSFLRILELLRREGFMLEPQETIFMLAERVKDHFRHDQILFEDVARIFMRYRYGEEAVTAQEQEAVAGFQDELMRRRRETQPRLKLWLEEFIFLSQLHMGWKQSQ
ncbi:hypothetical protein HNQ56_000108 [Anaerotaenia torta]|uniref:DUF4129 domain-containing transglutaminase family protein n=1 Tax=Anaerotaenia torta TaxID=433293 RepID=UPI003D1C2148